MKLDDVKPGLRVRTGLIGSTRGMTVAQSALAARAGGITGTVRQWVSGHGGDVWWVEHDDGAIAPYVFNEFDPA